MPFQTKKHLFKSLVLSKLLYGAGAWQAPHIHTLKSWHTQVFGLYRSLVPHVPRQEGVYDLDVIAACQLPHPLLLLTLQRFSLFDRVMQTEAMELLAVLQHQHPDHSWFSLVRDGLLRLVVLVPHMQLITWADMCDDQQIAQYCFERPKALRALGKQACKVYERYLSIWQQFRTFQKQFHDDVTAWNVQRSSREIPVQVGATYARRLCTAVFHDYQCLCGHVFKNMVMPTLPTGCLLKLSVTVQPLTDIQLQEIFEEEAQVTAAQKTQQRKQRHKWPMTQAHGPQRPWPWQKVLSQMCQDQRQTQAIPDQDVRLWIATVIQQSSSFNVLQALESLKQYAYRGDLAAKLYHAVEELLPLQFTVEHVEQRLVIHEAIVFWAQDALVPLDPHETTVPFATAQLTLADIRVPPVAKPAKVLTHAKRRRACTNDKWSVDDVVHQLHAQLQIEHSQIYALPPSVPRTLCERPVFLCVFSERRRPGDVQEHMQRFFIEFSIDAKVLLIDLALSSRYDVTNPVLMNQFFSWVKTGQVAGLLAAPPCETWSQARDQITESPNDPRPLRSATNPLCLQGLTGPELTQLYVANVILQTSIRLLLAAALSGVPGILEHPPEPTESSKPTIHKEHWAAQELREVTGAKALLAGGLREVPELQRLGDSNG
eukprot:Skav234790  [mRNA]  locus=scaffold69:110411:114246:+ [translate_table: standard]